ncbi:hypothetical protein RBS60_10895 [Sinomonas sp. ASV486]|uniref:hypothetical protein n=1 Tax=Sinomonas sp. ASV486 TaxID=3051170 RepID=UPI0027DE8A04|nr:hypothetical protein [Sinomonas sp. ASV486]MDQ4490705.1 hypothetical protein [Sinomonas sp. ASV486]
MTPQDAPQPSDEEIAQYAKQIEREARAVQEAEENLLFDIPPCVVCGTAAHAPDCPLRD